MCEWLEAIFPAPFRRASFSSSAFNGEQLLTTFSSLVTKENSQTLDIDERNSL